MLKHQFKRLLHVVYMSINVYYKEIWYVKIKSENFLNFKGISRKIISEINLVLMKINNRNVTR